MKADASSWSTHVFLLSLLISLHFSPTLTAQTIVVPDDYETIQKAIDAAAQHDTILVLSGTYHEFLVMKDSIVVVSEGVEDGQWTRAKRTIIHTDGLRDGEGKIPPVVNCADGSVLDGFTVTGMDTVNHHLPGHSHAVQNRGVSGIIKNCIVHGNGSTGIGSHEKDGRASHPQIIHNRVYNNFGIGIGFNHSSKGLAVDNIVYENREVGIGIQNGAAPLIEGNTVYENGWNGISARSMATPTIRANTVYSNGTMQSGEGMPEGAGAGISLDSTGFKWHSDSEREATPIEHNIVFDNPSGGIMSRNNARVAISQNEVRDNGNFQISITDSSNGMVDSNIVSIGFASSYDGGGIVIARKATAGVLNNRIDSCRGPGIAMIERAAAALEWNTVTDCTGAGIAIADSGTLSSVVHNTLKHNGAPGVQLLGGSLQLYYNLLVNNAGGGVSCNETSGVYIRNNTIVGAPGAAGRGVLTSRNDSQIHNNIATGYTVGFYIASGTDIDYNCTFNNQGYNGPPGTGGSHAIAADPRFVDAKNGDYHLLSSSPCIDSGDPGYKDPDGSRSDMGCFYYPQTSFVGANPPSRISNYELSATMRGGTVLIECRNLGISAIPTEASIYRIDGRKVATVSLSGGRGIWASAGAASGHYLVVVRGAEGFVTASVSILH